MIFALSAAAAPPVGPHAAQVAQFGPIPAPPAGVRLPARRATPGPDLRVYGYLAYWSDDLPTLPWDELTDLGIFAASANADGSLGETERWDIAAEAVAMGAPYGVRVDLVVTNFDPTSLEALLSSAASRAALIGHLADHQAATGAHGINVDFEGLPYSVKSEFVTFIADLEAAVGAVSLAGPAVDWAGSYDYSELTRYADIFVMGYGYHWGGSSHAGPQDPLFAGAGTVWAGVQSYSLSFTIDDYLTWGADPSRLILGLPLYGMRWPVSANEVPALTLGDGSAVVFADAWALGGGSYERDSASLYAWDGTDQTWYGDVDSVRARIAYVRDQTDLAGVGFWAMHYDGDDPAFWQMVREETTGGAATEPAPTGPTTGPTTGSTTGATGGPEPDPPYRRMSDCGCGSGAPGAAAFPLLAVALARRRRPAGRER